MFSILEMHYLQLEKSLSLTFLKLNFIFFTEGSCEDVMHDRVLLNISTVTGEWFRKFVFNFKIDWSLIITLINRNAMRMFIIKIETFELYYSVSWRFMKWYY